MHSGNWNWKTWAIIGLSSALLTACGHDDDDHAGDNQDQDGYTAYQGDSNHSRYSGVWVESDYREMYTRYASAVKQKLVPRFCRSSLYRPYRVPIILVQAKGYVFRYDAFDDVESQLYKHQAYMGFVDANGIFYSRRDGTVPRGYAPSRWAFRSRSVMEVDGDHLTVLKRGRSKTYVRTNDREIQRMTAMTAVCTEGYIDRDDDARYPDDGDYEQIDK